MDVGGWCGDDEWSWGILGAYVCMYSSWAQMNALRAAGDVARPRLACHSLLTAAWPPTDRTWGHLPKRLTQLPTHVMSCPDLWG